ncbi:MAG: hypothetical protein ACTSPB_20655 [Candidatus Thorarchaeota archaeon]
MIRALNYPEGVSEPIVLDLVFKNTEDSNLSKALIRFNPAIAKEFTPNEITTLMAWYADGEDDYEEDIDLELLPRLLDVLAPTWLGEPLERQPYLGRSGDSIVPLGHMRDTLEETIREFAGSIGGQSSQFYSQFCTSGRYEAWRQGRLYTTIMEIDDDGDYRTGGLYIPFWMTLYEPLPINQIVPLREFEFLFREQDLQDEIYQSLKAFLSKEGLNVRY